MAIVLTRNKGTSKANTVAAVSTSGNSGSTGMVPTGNSIRPSSSKSTGTTSAKSGNSGSTGMVPTGNSIRPSSSKSTGTTSVQSGNSGSTGMVPTGNSIHTSSDSSNNGSSNNNYIAADPQGVDNYHAKNTANEGQGMSSYHLSQLEKCGSIWNNADAQEKEALARGDTASADYWREVKAQAHEDAEEIRALYGYSGGEDGSLYIPSYALQEDTPKKQQQQQQQSTQSTTSPTPDYDLSEYLKQQAAAKLESDLANLKYAYDETLASYDAAAERLPQTYDTARNRTATQNALQQQYFNEYAAASGLSSGANAQARLAQSNAYQRDIASLNQAQANALSEIELEKSGLKREYENAVAQAKSTGNAALANSLYQELVRVQQLQREDAQFAAQLELAYKKFQWDQTSDLWQQSMSEQEMGLSELELALKYFRENSSSSNKKSSSSSSKGYDNGSLTAEQVKAMQTYYGLTPDGMWGPTSKQSTGMTAEKAWDQFISARLYLGDQKTPNPSLTSVTVYQDEGIIIWNGTAYHDTATLKRDILKASLTNTQLSVLEANLNSQGIVISLD